MSTYFESVFQFTEAGEAADHLSNVFGSAVIDREFRFFRQELVGDADVQLQTGRCDGSYSMAIEAEQFVIAFATGECLWEEGRDSGDMSVEPAIFQPRVPMVNRVGTTDNMGVIFDTAALQRTARLVYGRDDLDLTFDGPSPVNSAAAARWLAVGEMARSYMQGGVLADDLVRVSLFRLLSVAALESFRVIGDRRALHTSARRQLEVHRLAADFLHDHASLPITIDDAAEAAGATVPELVTAFRAHEMEHTSPTAYLRAVRLAAAHRDLVAGDPTRGDTVSVISRRWGFPSPGRFAADYRAAYGTAPKWTLDR